jgi:hypothetical protein
VSLLFYPALLLGLFWVFTPPLVPLAAAGYSLRQRRRESVRYLLCLVAANLLLVLPYFYTAARLVTPAASALLVLAAAGLAGLAPRLAEVVPRPLSRRAGGLDDSAS